MTPEEHPGLGQAIAACAAAFHVKRPEAHVLRGEERLFDVFVYRQPFLAVHLDYLGLNAQDPGPRLTDSELRFALSRPYLALLRPPTTV